MDVILDKEEFKELMTCSILSLLVCQDLNFSSKEKNSFDFSNLDFLLKTLKESYEVLSKIQMRTEREK